MTTRLRPILLLSAAALLGGRALAATGMNTATLDGTFSALTVAADSIVLPTPDRPIHPAGMTATGDTVSATLTPTGIPADATVAPADEVEPSKMSELKDKAKELADEAKEDLKESWQDTKESVKETGRQFWDNLKEKAQEWKEEATDFFDTHVKSQVVGKFEDNRRQCNQEFCDHLRGGFHAYKIKTYAPEFPEMPKKKAEPDTAWPELTLLTPAGVRSLSRPSAPAAPEPYFDELIQSNRIEIQADGVKVALDLEPRLNTYGIGTPTEKNLAAFWQKLSESRFDIPLRQLYEAAQRHHLNDWGFYRLTSAAAAAIYPKNKNGEQAAWTVFMLNQAGYAAKIGRMGEDKKTYRLLVLLPFYEKIYGCPYVEIGGAPFYIMEKLAGKQRNEPVYSYDGCFALGTAPLSLQFPACVAVPCLYEKNDRFAYNLRMLEFYKNYPCAPTALYLHAPCGEVLFKSIRHKCGPAADSLLSASLSIPVCNSLQAADDNTPTVGLIPMTSPDTAQTPDTTPTIQPTAPTQACLETVITYFGRFVSTYFDDNAKKKLKPEGHPVFPDEAYALKAGDAKDRAILHARLVRHFTGLPVLLAEYEKTALVGIALPQPPADAAGQALAAIAGDGLTYYLFNPNAKDGRFWHCPKPLREVPPVIVL